MSFVGWYHLNGFGVGAYVGSERLGDTSGSAERGARERLTGAHPLPFVLPHACAVGRAIPHVVRWAGLVVAAAEATGYASQACTGARKG